VIEKKASLPVGLFLKNQKVNHKGHKGYKGEYLKNLGVPLCPSWWNYFLFICDTIKYTKDTKEKTLKTLVFLCILRGGITFRFFGIQFGEEPTCQTT
jgi:hypothetical protein